MKSSSMHYMQLVWKRMLSRQFYLISPWDSMDFFWKAPLKINALLFQNSNHIVWDFTNIYFSQTMWLLFWNRSALILRGAFQKKSIQFATSVSKFLFFCNLDHWSICKSYDMRLVVIRCTHGQTGCVSNIDNRSKCKLQQVLAFTKKKKQTKKTTIWSTLST